MAASKASSKKTEKVSLEEEFKLLTRRDKVRDDKRRKLGLPLDGTERIFLAQEHCADGDDSSEFVMAILTNEETENAAYAGAETIAEKYDAKIIAAHDGASYYRVVRDLYPPVVSEAKVGTYPAFTYSGGGFVYDDVLEYRVWIHPVHGGDDYFFAFKSYSEAKVFSKKTEGAEEPLALVLQRQWMVETQPGVREVRKGKRIAEWQVSWLASNKRTKETVTRLLNCGAPSGKDECKTAS